GTDLSKSNLQKSWDHSDAAGLPRFSQVLVPRTAGFAAAWSSLCDVAKERGSVPPLLLDVTMAYVDFVPGELPNEVSVFKDGRCVREVHVLVRRVNGPGLVPPDRVQTSKFCQSIFAEKEERLSRFYAPTSAGSLPDTSALGGANMQLLEHLPGVPL
ncbi:unnamed protein product, partial [Polarella glacialis]